MEAPEKKESRTGSIIGAVAAIVLCGLSGLCLLCPLSIYLFTGTMPDFVQGYGEFPAWWGVLPLCVSIVFIAIGVVVPIVLLRKKKPAAEAPADSGEPLPPAS